MYSPTYLKTEYNPIVPGKNFDVILYSKTVKKNTDLFEFPDIFTPGDTFYIGSISTSSSPTDYIVFKTKNWSYVVPDSPYVKFKIYPDTKASCIKDAILHVEFSVDMVTPYEDTKIRIECYNSATFISSNEITVKSGDYPAKDIKLNVYGIKDLTHFLILVDGMTPTLDRTVTVTGVSISFTPTCKWVEVEKSSGGSLLSLDPDVSTISGSILSPSSDYNYSTIVPGLLPNQICFAPDPGGGSNGIIKLDRIVSHGKSWGIKFKSSLACDDLIIKYKYESDPTQLWWWDETDDISKATHLTNGFHVINFDIARNSTYSGIYDVDIDSIELISDVYDPFDYIEDLTVFLLEETCNFAGTECENSGQGRDLYVFPNEKNPGATYLTVTSSDYKEGNFTYKKTDTLYIENITSNKLVWIDNTYGNQHIYYRSPDGVDAPDNLSGKGYDYFAFTKYGCEGNDGIVSFNTAPVAYNTVWINGLKGVPGDNVYEDSSGSSVIGTIISLSL